jgi:hypothetical protein
MDFLKKHYEKILLALVVLGSVGLLVYMPILIKGDRDEATRHIEGSRKVTPLAEQDLTAQNQLVQRLGQPLGLDLDTTNKLLNPVEWQKTQDGQLVRRANIGEKVLQVTKITPLYLLIVLDKVETNELGSRYSVGVQHQAATRVSQQRLQHHYVSVGDKNDAFQLLSVDGPADNPQRLNLKLMDTGETVALQGSTPYQRVDGYSADLRYDPEHKVFANRRVGATISFGGDDYIVVAIEADKVILSNQSNQKRIEFKYSAAP